MAQKFKNTVITLNLAFKAVAYPGSFRVGG
jgi:hypothetical protein